MVTELGVSKPLELYDNIIKCVKYMCYYLMMFIKIWISIYQRWLA